MNSEKSERLIKKIITGVILVLIACLAAYIIIFSFGLKIDWKNFEVNQTSILAVRTNPSGATAHLDSNSIKKTPFEKRWIMPGSYQLRLSKEGYQDFTTQINPQPGLVTEVEGVKLFWESPISRKIGDSDQVEMVSSSSGYLVEDNKVNFFSISPNKNREIYTNDKTIKSFLVNKKFSRAIINSNKVIDLLSGKLLLSLGESFVKYRNFQFLDDETVLARKRKILYSIDISKKEAKKLIELKNTKQYLVVNNLLYYITSQDSPQLIAKDGADSRTVIATDELTVENNQSNIQKVFDLSKTKMTNISGYLVLEHSGARAVYDNGLFLVFDDGKVIRQIKRLGSSRYLVTNDLNEIYLKDFNDSDNNQTYIRSSKQIVKAGFLTDNYLIYQQGEDLHVYSTKYRTGWQVDGKIRVEKYWPISTKNILVLTKQGQLLELQIS